jgi:hypothetical protein
MHNFLIFLVFKKKDLLIISKLNFKRNRVEDGQFGPIRRYEKE